MAKEGRTVRDFICWFIYHMTPNCWGPGSEMESWDLNQCHMGCSHLRQQFNPQCHHADPSEYIHLLVPRGYYPPARRRNVRQDEATEEMEQSAVAGTRFIPESRSWECWVLVSEDHPLQSVLSSTVYVGAKEAWFSFFQLPYPKPVCVISYHLPLYHSVSNLDPKFFVLYGPFTLSLFVSQATSSTSCWFSASLLMPLGTAGGCAFGSP